MYSPFAFKFGFLNAIFAPIVTSIANSPATGDAPSTGSPQLYPTHRSTSTTPAAFAFRLLPYVGRIKATISGFLAADSMSADDFERLGGLQSEVTTLNGLVHDYAVTRNEKRSPATRLPSELVCMITWLLIWNDPPRTAAHWTSAQLGWLIMLWACGPWRRAVMANPRIFAHAYSQLPMAILWFRYFAKDQPLFYEISNRSAMPVSGIDPASDAQFSILTRLLHSADFRSCVSIIVELRGPVIVHLWRLALLSPLECLEYLRVVVEDASAEVVRIHQWAFNHNEGGQYIIRAPRLLRAIFVNCWIAIASDALQVLDVHIASANAHRPSVATFLRTLTGTNLAGLRFLRLQTVFGTFPLMAPANIPVHVAPLLSIVDLADEADNMNFLIDHMTWGNIACPVFRVLLDDILENAYREIPRAVMFILRSGFEWNTITVDIYDSENNFFEISFSLSQQDEHLFLSSGEPGIVVATLTFISSGPDSWWIKVMQLTLDSLALISYSHIRLQLDASHFKSHFEGSHERPVFLSPMQCAADAINMCLLYRVHLHLHVKSSLGVPIATPILTWPSFHHAPTATSLALTALPSSGL